ncbi:uncharacterized protein Dwil_GK13875 [Drosophila willistoni]|uniref:Saposin A-type domain-containing protein n=1 Tax=Drosophila willistoni TaxID=7260 RepID=B4NJL9_DROWI|nr:GILT-like protein 2 [Drosophila willistoni]EDW83943.1 uncharacterized protein Dwil_GK13875 [Drosophila willistoni]
MKSLLLWLLLVIPLVTEITAKHHHNRGLVVNKLPITLYYEALCPFCMEFVTKQLNPSMIHKDRLAYTDLTFVPYGNAQTNADGNVTCQHGVDECELNAWHGCILEHHNQNESLKLIACMMRGKKNKLDNCSERYQIDVSDVKECKQNRSVNEILAKYARESSKVQYRGVPAITVDNIFVEDDQDNLYANFDAVFCAKYKAKFNKTLQNC